MADAPRTPRPGGFTLDLSSGATPGGAPSRARKKAPPAVVTQTINLSTPKPVAALASAVPETPALPRRTKPPPPPRAERPRGGTSLADLLDDATLARLRGAG